jgi:hypothetical protein
MAEIVDEKKVEGGDTSAGRGRTADTESQLAALKLNAEVQRPKKLTELEIEHYFWRIRHMLEELYDLEEHMTEEERARFRDRLDVGLRRRKN